MSPLSIVNSPSKPARVYWADAVDAAVVSSFVGLVTHGAADECWPWRSSRSQGGYGSFAFMRKGHRYGVPAHRFAYLVANDRAPAAGKHICHRCDNPICCNPAHLFEGTPKQNGEDRVAKGRQTRGESHGTSKLTTADVVEMRARRAAGESPLSLANSFRVSQALVSLISRGLYWGHVQ